MILSSQELAHTGSCLCLSHAAASGDHMAKEFLSWALWIHCLTPSSLHPVWLWYYDDINTLQASKIQALDKVIQLKSA